MTKPKSNSILLSADTSDEFSRALERLDVQVPSRAEMRTTDHVERHTVARLLTTLPKDRFDYPLSISHGDTPDFRLTMGSRTVGIEHTEGITENEAHAQALRAKGNGPSVYFVPHPKLVEAKKSSKQLILEIQADEPSEPWFGDSAERDWAQFMRHFLQRKAVAFNRSEFEKFSQNWLVIYDNLPLPHVDLEKAAALLFENLNSTDGFSDFDHIFVVSGQDVCEFSIHGQTIHRSAALTTE